MDPLSGCWTVPVLVESSWEDLLHENKLMQQEARDESIMRQIDFDSVNLTHFATCLADYWQCDGAQVLGLICMPLGLICMPYIYALCFQLLLAVRWGAGAGPVRVP